MKFLTILISIMMTQVAFARQPVSTAHQCEEPSVAAAITFYVKEIASKIARNAPKERAFTLKVNQVYKDYSNNTNDILLEVTYPGGSIAEQLRVFYSIDRSQHCKIDRVDYKEESSQ